MSPRGALLARLEALERRSAEGELEVPWNARNVPWLLVETRDGEIFTDDQGREFDRHGLDQLKEEYRLIVVNLSGAFG